MCICISKNRKFITIIAFFVLGFSLLLTASLIEDEDMRLADGCVAMCCIVSALLVGIRDCTLPKDGYKDCYLVAVTFLDIYLAVMIGIAIALSILAFFDIMNAVAGLVFMAFGYIVPFVGYVVLGVTYALDNNKKRSDTNGE